MIFTIEGEFGAVKLEATSAEEAAIIVAETIGEHTGTRNYDPFQLSVSDGEKVREFKFEYEQTMTLVLVAMTDPDES